MMMLVKTVWRVVMAATAALRVRTLGLKASSIMDVKALLNMTELSASLTWAL